MIRSVVVNCANCKKLAGHTYEGSFTADLYCVDCSDAFRALQDERNRLSAEFYKSARGGNGQLPEGSEK